MQTVRALINVCFCLSTCYAHAQAFQKLKFDNLGKARTGNQVFRLIGPDNAAHPDLWEGPLGIASGPKECIVDVSLIKDVYLDGVHGQITVVTFNGSNTYVSFFDTSTCMKRWDRIKAFTDGVSLRDNRLIILPACTPTERNQVSQCSAGRVYEMKALAAPILLPLESNTLNERLVGLSFTGDQKISRPKTKHAKLAEGIGRHSEPPLRPY